MLLWYLYEAHQDTQYNIKDCKMVEIWQKKVQWINQKLIP